MMSIPEMNDDCMRIAPLVAARSGSPLPARDEAAVAQHLARCGRCAEVAALLWLDREVDQIADPLADRSPFAAPVEPERAAPRTRSSRWIAIAAATVAAAAAIVLALWIGRDRPPEPADRTSATPAAPAEAGAGRRMPPPQPAPPPARPAPAPSQRPPSPPPAPPTETDDPAPERTLDTLGAQEISDAIARVRSQLHQCGEQHGFAGKVTMTVEVGPDGTVVSATPSRRTGRAGKCIAALIASLRFPSSRNGSSFRYPVVVRPDASRWIERAEEAARQSQYRKALRLCEKALRIEDRQDAVVICAISACNLRSKAKAARYVARISSESYRGLVRQVCLRNGFDPVGSGND